MNGIRVLVLLPLFVGLVHSFSWEIVVGEGKRLKFFNNGTLTHTKQIPSAKEIRSVIYDPVDFRVFFADWHDTKISISSYDIITGEIKEIVKRFRHPYPYESLMYANLAYDPLKQLLFWCEDEKIYSMSLKPATSNDTAASNITEVVTLNGYCRSLVVDSCRGYIYWLTDDQIERATFDGSEREILVVANVKWRRSLIIDQQTQTMFWIDAISKSHEFSIEISDLNGKNRRTFYSLGDEFEPTALTVSKDYIYWKSYSQKAILRLPKYQQYGVAPTVYAGITRLSWQFPLLAANYIIEEQTLGIKSCEALRSLTQNKNSSDVELECSTCLNYCFKGNCSITAEGRPNCSCEAGYAGQRCEINVCYKHCLHGGVCYLNDEKEPGCQCTAGYEGERCDVTTPTTDVQAKDTKKKIEQGLPREENKVTLEELKRALIFFSEKIADYEANFD